MNSSPLCSVYTRSEAREAVPAQSFGRETTDSTEINKSCTVTIMGSSTPVDKIRLHMIHFYIQYIIVMFFLKNKG